MKHIAVRFCVECGYFCDAIQPERGKTQWIDAHAYLIKYGLRWEDLDRTDDACQPCARVLACATRGVLPERQAGEPYPSVGRKEGRRLSLA